MGTVEFEWEEIVVASSKRGGNRGKPNRIWITAKNTRPNDDRLNVINIAGNMCEEAGWYDGIRVNLARQGNSLFRLKPSTVGLYYVRKNGKSKTLRITNVLLVAELRPHINGTIFDAWVDGDTIYFKPKK